MRTKERNKIMIIIHPTNKSTLILLGGRLVIILFVLIVWFFFFSSLLLLLLLWFNCRVFLILAVLKFRITSYDVIRMIGQGRSGCLINIPSKPSLI